MQSLKIRQLGEDRSVELVPPGPVRFWGIAFAPSGWRVFYAIKSAQEPGGRLFAIGILGGTPQPLLDGIDSTVTFSADGRRMAFYRANHPERGTTSLLTANIDGSDVRVLASTGAPEFFVPAFFAAPSWSPDGARVAAAVHSATTNDAVLATFDASTGERQPFDAHFQDITFTAWLKDGSGILFVATQADAFREFPRKVWLQPFPRGEPYRVTPDLLEYPTSLSGATGRRSRRSGSTRSTPCGVSRLEVTTPSALPRSAMTGCLVSRHCPMVELWSRRVSGATRNWRFSIAPGRHDSY